MKKLGELLLLATMAFAPLVDRMAAQDPDPEARRRALKTQAELAK